LDKKTGEGKVVHDELERDLAAVNALATEERTTYTGEIKHCRNSFELSGGLLARR
jgi:hypothetical protein